MFGFLKKKIQEAIGSFSKKAEKEADVVEEPEEKKEDLEKEIKESAKKGIIKEKKAETKEQEKEKKHEQKPKEEKQREEKKQLEKKKEEIKKEIKEHKTIHEEKVIKKVEEEKPEIIERKKENIIEKKEEDKKPGFFGKLFGAKEEKKAEEEKPKGFFGKISDSFTQVSLSENKFEELFWDLEIGLLENNVAVEVIEKIKKDLRKELVDKKLPRGQLEQKVISALKESIEGLFNVEKIDLIKRVKTKKPYVIIIIGINGSGKTTTIGKLINLFKKNNLTCVVGACDTFRAAAIQQLEEHTNKLGVKLIKHDYGSDPAAVAFDTVQHARAKGEDIVLIDTAGRLHSNTNLMAELDKVMRVVKPDMKIFIGESIAGNDVVEQVKLFNEKAGIDGIILSKADIDEKGGAAISVSYVTGKPILFLGMGQGYDDLIEFNKEKILAQIGF